MFRRLTKKTPAPTPKRVLLAWEYGAGRTHYANLLSVATHLRAAGVECLATLHDNTAADREFAAIGVRTLQNYIWPAQLAWNTSRRSMAMRGFSDLLAMLGFNSRSAVAGAIAHYDTLFSIFKPDLILCEQAYGGLLAARDVIPVVAFGSSMGLPPVVEGNFPLIPPRTRTEVPPEVLLSEINQGLAIAGRFSLDRIGDILGGAQVFVFGPRDFDPYDGQRREPLLPPNVPDLLESIPETPDGDEVFVYLHSFVQDHLPAVEALCAAGLPTRAFIPGLGDQAHALLLRAGIVIENRAVPLPDIFRRSRIVVHHGGPQLTCACLAAGIPQVILSKELDNKICGAFVEAHGLGWHHWFHGIERDTLLAALRDTYANAAMRAKARTDASRFRKWFPLDSSAFIAQRIGEAIGIEI